MNVFRYTPQGNVEDIFVFFPLIPPVGAEVASAWGVGGEKYVVDLLSRVIVVGPRYANYNAWRELRDPEGVFWCCAYTGDARLDRLIMKVPERV